MYMRVQSLCRDMDIHTYGTYICVYMYIDKDKHGLGMKRS